MKKRLLSSVLALAMVLSMLPVSVFATDDELVYAAAGLGESSTIESSDEVLGIETQAYNYLSAAPMTMSEGTDSGIPEDTIGGTSNPFYIYNAETMQELADLIDDKAVYGSYSYADASYVLGDDIDMSGRSWTEIADFNGTFDGDGKIIYYFADTDHSATYEGVFDDDVSGTISNVLATTLYKDSLWDGTSTTAPEDGNITTAAEFAYLAQNSTTILSGTYTLTTDIDLGGKTKWTPIGDNSNNFTGSFDGGNHEIIGLYVERNSMYSGLFGYSTGTIENVSVSGSVTGVSNTGGVVGYNKGTISNCSFSGSVTSTGSQCGGVVGYNYADSGNITVSNCYNTGKVTGSGNSVGGVVGYNYATGGNIIISNCYNTGDVTSTATSGTSVGGVVGYNNTSSDSGGTITVSNCYNTGSVTATGSQYVGGVVGYNQSSSTVQYCYNTGNVEGSSRVGGVVGYNYKSSGTTTVQYCVALNESVTGASTSTSPSNIGRVVGRNTSGTCTGNYAWSGMTCTSTSNGDNGTDLTYTSDDGFDTTWSTIFGDDTDWTGTATTLPNGDAVSSYISDSTTDEGTTEPTDNYWTSYASTAFADTTNNGSSEENAIEISSAADLAYLADQVTNNSTTYSGTYFKLTANIDLSAHEWVAIGTSSSQGFQGTFDGDGHTISGLYINTSTDYQGLFGYTSGATIQNVNVVGNITGGDYTGGVVGYNYNGTVERCSFSGSVKGTHYTGGVVGKNYADSGTATISNCYNTGSVTGTQYIGGVVGDNYADSSNATATVENCYNTGNVTGTNYIGGVVGESFISDGATGSVTNCLSLANTITGTGNYIGRVVGLEIGSTMSGLYAWSGTNAGDSTFTLSLSTNATNGKDGADLYYSSANGFTTDAAGTATFTWSTICADSDVWDTDNTDAQLPKLTGVSVNYPQNPLANITMVTVTFDDDDSSTTNKTVSFEIGGQLTASDLPDAPDNKIWDVDLTTVYTANATIKAVDIVASVTVGEVVTDYSSIAYAIAAANEITSVDEIIVELLGDNSTTTTLSITNTMTLDLNDYEITNDITISDSSKLYLKAGTLSGAVTGTGEIFVYGTFTGTVGENVKLYVCGTAQLGTSTNYYLYVSTNPIYYYSTTEGYALEDGATLYIDLANASSSNGNALAYDEDKADTNGSTFLNACEFTNDTGYFYGYDNSSGKVYIRGTKIDTDSKIIYANGWSLFVEDGTTTGYSKVWIDVNYNEEYDATDVLVYDDKDLSDWTIYGGTNGAISTTGTTVYIYGGNVGTIYGGSLNANITSSSVGAQVFVNGGTVGTIYAGSNNNTTDTYDDFDIFNAAVRMYGGTVGAVYASGTAGTTVEDNAIIYVYCDMSETTFKMGDGTVEGYTSLFVQDGGTANYVDGMDFDSVQNAGTLNWSGGTIGTLTASSSYMEDNDGDVIDNYHGTTNLLFNPEQITNIRTGTEPRNATYVLTVDKTAEGMSAYGATDLAEDFVYQPVDGYQTDGVFIQVVEAGVTKLYVAPNLNTYSGTGIGITLATDAQYDSETTAKVVIKGVNLVDIGNLTSVDEQALYADTAIIYGKDADGDYTVEVGTIDLSKDGTFAGSWDTGTDGTYAGYSYTCNEVAIDLSDADIAGTSNDGGITVDLKIVLNLATGVTVVDETNKTWNTREFANLSVAKHVFDFTGTVDTVDYTDDTVGIALDSNSSLADSAFTITYYAIGEDGNVGAVVSAPEETGEYLYVIALNGVNANLYELNSDAVTSVTTDGTVAATTYTAKSNAGILTIRSVDSEVTPGVDQEDKTYTYGETIKLTATIEIAEETQGNTQMAMQSFSLTPSTNDVIFTATDSENNEVTLGTVTASGTGEQTVTLDYATTDKIITPGTYIIKAYYGGSSNLNLNNSGENTVEITLTKKALSATVLESDTTATKVYDGDDDFTNVALTLTADATGTTANAYFTGDSVTATATTGDRASANVTGDATFTATEIALTGDHADYYSLETTAVTGDVAITKYVLLAVPDATKVYDSTATFTETVDGVNDETVVITADTTSEAVGTYTSGTTYAFTVDEATSTNYVVDSNDEPEYEITIKTIVAVWTGTSTVYDGESQAPTVAFVGVEGEDNAADVYTSMSVYDTAGSHTVTLTEATNSNYTVSNPTTSFTISKAPVTFAVSENVVEYTGSAQTATVEADVESENYNITYKTSKGVEVENPTDNGTYYVYAEITNENYRHATTTDGAAIQIGILTIYTTAPATYDVTFDDGTSAIEDSIAGTVHTLPAGDNKSATEVFAGWTYNSVTYKAGDSFTQPSKDVAFEAVYSVVHDIHGFVYAYGTETGIEGVVVTLMKGSTQEAYAVTGADGSYAFDSYIAGVYNVVASHDSTTKTELADISLTDADVIITMPQYKTSSVLEVAAGTPDIVVGGLDDIAATLVTESNSTDVAKITLTVEQTTVTVDAIEEAASNVGLYLNIDVTKTVNDSTSDVTDTGTQLIEFIIPIPADYQNKASYTIYREHEGDIHEITTTPNDDGEYLEVSEDKTSLTLHVCKFSTYALAYTEYSNSSISSSTYSATVASTDNGNVSVSASKASSGTTVTITPEPDDGYEVGDVTVTYSSGREVSVTDNGDGTYSYTQPGAAVTVTVTFVEIGSESESGFFADVAEDAYYYDAVEWAVEAGITTGYEDETFRPSEIGTRAQAVTFLYRAMGEPEYELTENPFEDMTEDMYYYHAVLWAVANGIVVGTSDSAFSPDGECSRAHIVTMLCRMADESDIETENIFDDIDNSDYFYESVLWAIGEGITNGTADETFSPYELCDRAQIVTFLYRYIVE